MSPGPSLLPPRGFLPLLLFAALPLFAVAESTPPPAPGPIEGIWTGTVTSPQGTSAELGLDFFRTPRGQLIFRLNFPEMFTYGVTFGIPVEHAAADDYAITAAARRPERCRRDFLPDRGHGAAVPPDRHYRSKLDVWLVGLVLALAAAPLLAGLWLRWHGIHRGTVILFGWGTVMTAATVTFGFPLRYALQADHLQIQSGWLEWEVPYARLRRVAASRNPLAGPAWSLRRVRLDCADGTFILVSPDDRESFIRELTARCPHLSPAQPPSP